MEIYGLVTEEFKLRTLSRLVIGEPGLLQFFEKIKERALKQY